MKKIFYIGLAGVGLFEFLKQYFISPMPGSQEINSLDTAYFLYTHRWIFRIILWLMIAVGSYNSFQSNRKWIPALSILTASLLTYLFNFQMTAENIFRQPKQFTTQQLVSNSVDGNALVIGVEINGEAKAYPIHFLAYHHQIQDSIGGMPIIVTYCSVCRTGQVFEPLVMGHYDKFRLVGMDHFNSMFEDASTKSWWRQSTGEAVAGSMKGEMLPLLVSMQMTVNKWFELYPFGMVMQPDEDSKAEYAAFDGYEQGLINNELLRTDSLSWKEKSWVIGIEAAGQSKAYDWNELKKENVINDMVGQTPIVLVLASDGQSFAAFERPSNENFTIHNDTLFSNGEMYSFSGNDLRFPTQHLKMVKAYQQFWHGWRTFHPGTLWNQ